MCVTAETIFDAIDCYYSGDVPAFLAAFIDYCNDHTFFDVPRKHSPLAEVRCEFDSVLCETCDVLQYMTDGVEPALIELQDVSGADSFAVYAIRYYRDSATNEVFPEDWAPYFILTSPEELASLCGYVGVNFCSDFFEE